MDGVIVKRISMRTNALRWHDMKLLELHMHIAQST